MPKQGVSNQSCMLGHWQQGVKEEMGVMALWDIKWFMTPELVERERRKGRIYLVYVYAYV